jgi:hypothetical protein
MFRIRLRELPPPAGELLTRAVLVAHASIEGTLVLSRCATCLCDIELRHAVRGGVCADRRGWSRERDHGSAAHAGGDERVAGRLMPVTSCRLAGWEHSRRFSRAAMGREQDLVLTARDDAARGVTARAHDANGRTRAKWSLRSRQALRALWSGRSGWPGWSSRTGGTGRSGIALHAGRAGRAGRPRVTPSVHATTHTDNASTVSRCTWLSSSVSRPSEIQRVEEVGPRMIEILRSAAQAPVSPPV